MTRVCSVVVNSVSHDSRVLKQADTLAAAGYDVTIVGIVDSRERELETIRASGVRIIRVNPLGDLLEQQRLRRLRKAEIRRARKTVWVRASRLLLAAALLASIVTVPSSLQATLTYPLLVVAGSIFIPRRETQRVLLRFHRSVERVRRSLSTLVSTLVLRNLSDNRLVKVLVADRLWIRHMIWKLAPKIALRLTRIEIYTDAIAEQVLALRPEIVHCHDVHTLPVGAAAKIQIGSSIVYDAHEIYEAVAQVNGRRAEHYKQLHKKYAASVSRFITINESIGEWYATNHPKLPRATIIMNATVPAGKITYDGRLHTASGLADSSRIVLYQGGFAHKRGLSQLVESAARLPLDWYLVMMGGGQIQRRLEDTAAKVNSHCREAGRADDVVRFVPAAPLPELAQWTGGATLGVIPYEDAGLNHHFCTPNKLWEYPNAGVPLLVSPLPEMVRIVQKHNIGWVLPRFGDSPEFASGVPDVVANLTDESLARAREACTAFIAQESWDKYAIELVELYSSLASEKQGRN